MMMMAKTALYIVAHRRRRERKTDYKARLRMVKSGKPRLVIRKSLSHMAVQLMGFEPAGDRTIASATSQELKEYGWKAGCGNLSAAYLTGLLAGIRAKKQGVSEAVLDIGLQISTKGSRIYAALKGVLDAGISVPHDKGILPPQERIAGGHIAAYAKAAGGAMFTKYRAAGIQPSEMKKHFEAVKQSIEAKGE